MCQKGFQMAFFSELNNVPHVEGFLHRRNTGMELILPLHSSLLTIYTLYSQS